MVALDFHGDQSLRRELREEEEFVLSRGREHEARIANELGWPEPEYRTGDFAAGAEQTLTLLRRKVVGVSQGVLCEGELLGIPDLLRRESGASELGEHHYVVGDIKSSARVRGDQLLQVSFYSRMLARLQGLQPEYGFLIMKDGREERFDLEDYAPVLEDLLQRVADLRTDASAARPFHSRACDTCRWSEVCGPELVAKEDLSLISGMTAGIRQTLEAAGLDRCPALAEASVEGLARTTRLEVALVRRLKAAAQTYLAAKPRLERRSKLESLAGAGILHFLTDPYEDRVLFMGLLLDKEGNPEIHTRCPQSREEERQAFEEMVGRVPGRTRLLHYGTAIPRWWETQTHRRTSSLSLEKRMLDLARQLRGAAIYPAPIFGLAEHVRFGLDRDPHRSGRASASALYAGGDQGQEWLLNKGRSDLLDLLALKAEFLR